LPLVIATIEHEKLEKYIHREISHQGFKWLRKEAIIVTAILLERNILAYEDIDSVHLPSTLKYTQLFSKKTSHSLRRYLPEINKKEGKQFDIKLSCWKESWEKETLLTYEKDQKFLIIYI
jgi:hypothetical protein